MNFVDLFAGSGGLSEGFIRSGFHPIAHVESNIAACFTLKTRMTYHWLNNNGKTAIYKKYLQGKISRDELYSHVPDKVLHSVINEIIGEDTLQRIFKQIDELLINEEINVIVGGPPCQAYSIVGRSRDKSKMEGDSRNYLYRYYGRFLKKYCPQVFVFENVVGLKSAAKGKYLKNMKAYFKRIGYKLDLEVLNANDFGVLQNRNRILLIGWKKGLNFKYPKFNKEKVRFKVKSIFSDLEKIQAGEGIEKNGKYQKRSNKYLRDAKIRNGIHIVTQHVTRPHTDQDKEIYRIVINKWNDHKQRLSYPVLPDYLKTHKNETSFMDRFKIVAANERQSQTVVAHIAKDGHYYIHPDINQNRSISVREAARLQSFPDDYYFEGIREGICRTSAFTQIGNAVPPLMAEKIASKIAEFLK